MEQGLEAPSCDRAPVQQVPSSLAVLVGSDARRRAIWAHFTTPARAGIEGDKAGLAGSSHPQKPGKRLQH